MNDLIKQALDAAHINEIESVFLPMKTDKQWDLRKATDSDKDPANDKAFKAACAYFSAVLCLETMAGRDIDIVASYEKAVAAGAVRKSDALIWSYEKIAKAVGVPVKSFKSEYINNHENQMRELLRSGVPLIIFIGAPNDLDHVEACFGFVSVPGECLFVVRDVGWQSDTHFSEKDKGMFHFEGSARKSSLWKAGKPRHAYKFGWFDV